MGKSRKVHAEPGVREEAGRCGEGERRGRLRRETPAGGGLAAAVPDGARQHRRRPAAVSGKCRPFLPSPVRERQTENLSFEQSNEKQSSKIYNILTT